MSIDLLFSGAAATSGALVFGADTSEPVSKNATAVLNAELPGIVGSVSLSLAKITLHLSAALPALSGIALLEAEYQASVSFSGKLPSLTGGVELSSSALAVAHLFSSFPELSGQANLSVRHRAIASFSGDLPELTGELALLVRHRAIASFSGELPEITGELSLLVRHRTTVNFDAELPDLQGEIALSADQTVAFNDAAGDLSDITLKAVTATAEGTVTFVNAEAVGDLNTLVLHAPTGFVRSRASAKGVIDNLTTSAPLATVKTDSAASGVLDSVNLGKIEAGVDRRAIGVIDSISLSVPTPVVSGEACGVIAFIRAKPVTGSAINYIPKQVYRHTGPPWSLVFSEPTVVGDKPGLVFSPDIEPPPPPQVNLFFACNF